MNEDIILLYGSHAKNESNQFSDIDVLVVTEKNFFNLPYEILLKNNISPEKIDIKIMKFDSFKKLIDINSLYIHHLVECNIILEGEKKFHFLTRNLSDYQIQEKEINDLAGLAEDSLYSINKNGINILDLSLLFTFLRNALLLINYKKGILEFNKMKIFDVYESGNYTNKFLRDAYILCHDAKLKIQRGYLRNPIKSRWNNTIKLEIEKFVVYFKKGEWR